MYRSALLPLHLFCLLLALVFSPLSQAEEISGTWKGSYECRGKVTGITLTFVDELTAQIDVFPSAADTEPTGSFWMEVWRRDAELHLIGTDWIKKPRWNLFNLRLGLSDPQMLAGTIEVRGCDKASLVKSEPSASTQSALAIAGEHVPNTDFQLTSLYQCKKKFSGSYWKITRVDDNRYDIDVSVRAYRTANRATSYTIEARKYGAGLQGFTQKGRFGVQLDFTADNKEPVGYWLDKNGFRDETCLAMEFQSAALPADYWREYFSLVKNNAPNIDDVVDLTSRYRTLPNEKTATEPLPTNFPAERDRLWKAFTKNYIDALPDQLSALAVDTPEARQKTRIQIARMQNPGFRTNIDFSSYYAAALVKQGLPVEPIHFVDVPGACQQANTSVTPNSALAVESYIGLSGYDWTDDSLEKYIAMLEACATDEKVDPTVVAAVAKQIRRYAPSIMQKAQMSQQLKDAVNAMQEQPKTLASLVATKGYTVNIYGLNKMSAATYDRLFESPIAPIREEAIRNASDEIDSLLAQGDSVVAIGANFDQCRKALGVVHAKPPEYLKSLSERCSENASQKLGDRLEFLSAQLDEFELKPEELRNYLNVYPNFDLRSLAQRLGQQEKFDEYNIKRQAFDSRAKEAYVSELKALFESNTEQGDEEFIRACRDITSRLTFPVFAKLCTGSVDELRARKSQRECESTIQTTSLSANLLDELVLYGDGVQLREITIRDLVCKVSKTGLELKFDENSSMLPFEAVDRNTKRTLFNAAMTPADDGSGAWVVNSLDGAVANTKFGNINHTELVHCLLSSWGC